MRFSRRKKNRLIIIWISLLLIIIYLFIKIDKEIKPVLLSVSSSEVRILATEAINKVVKDELSKNVKYSDLINIKTDKNGDISAIEMNTVEMNKFGSSVALRVQDEMRFIGGRGVKVPMGAITRSSFLSYLGPQINVKVLPVGNVSTDFKSELQSAGINQCRYRVYIVVNINLKMIIPLAQDSVDVISTIPIAETLIVGKVPESYFNSEAGQGNVPNVVPVPTK